MTDDDDLVEADRLEEDGRWEEAAVLRLAWPGGTAWYDIGEVEVWAEVWVEGDGLRVEVHRCRPCRTVYWFWGGEGWTSTPDPSWANRTAAGRCAPEVRRAVAEAVRQALESRFRGDR